MRFGGLWLFLAVFRGIFCHLYLYFLIDIMRLKSTISFYSKKHVWILMDAVFQTEHTIRYEPPQDI